MSANSLGEHARALDEAWARAVAVPAPSTVDPELTTDDAYAIQDLVIARRLQAGRRIGGWKLGLTSAAPPTTPIVGTLLDDMVLPTGSDLSLATMVAPHGRGGVRRSHRRDRRPDFEHRRSGARSARWALIERGRPLERGDVILTGSLTGHHRVPADRSEFVADFGDLGRVSVRFHP